jgi:ABC-type molybdenum transport system ATPase subunit/photorepair protein PhrA
MIKLRDVSCIIDNRHILKHIDWTVRKGEHWAVIGLNGAGKTTLLNMLNGYVFPAFQQEVRITSLCLMKPPPHRLRMSCRHHLPKGLLKNPGISYPVR